MKRARFRRSIVHSRRCRCGQDKPSGVRTTTNATALRRCLLHWMWPRAKSSASCTADTAPPSSANSSIALTRKCQPTWRVHLVLDKMHPPGRLALRSEEHTSELQSRVDLVCRLLLEKKKKKKTAQKNKHK